MFFSLSHFLAKITLVSNKSDIDQAIIIRLYGHNSANERIVSGMYIIIAIIKDVLVQFCSRPDAYIYLYSDLDV